VKNIFLILLLLVTTVGYNQEVLNLRYNLNYNNTIFENIIVTDSCYYTTSYSIPINSNKVEGSFIKINLDGTVNFVKHHVSDTMNIQFISTHSNLVNTLDNKFAILAKITNFSGESSLSFYKMKPSGDTLLTTFIDNSYFDGNIILNVNELIQNTDSTFFSVIHLDNYSSQIGSISLTKLSKTGELLWNKYYYGLSPSNYRILKGNSVIKYGANKLIIGGTLMHIPFGGSESHLNRIHTKLIVTDTLGNLIEARTYWEDSLNYTVNGLTKTVDNGLLYCGKYGRYFEYQNGVYSNSLRYKGQITKLDANFDLEWRLELGHYGSANYGLNNLITLNDSEFVAVGNTYTKDSNGIPNGRVGWLVKFNITGKVLWERKYTKVPLFDGEINAPTHILYDVDMTTDSGFVMMGQSNNYYGDNGVGPGQQGWLVKVDKHGCLVPNCQQYDNIDTTTTDTTVVDTTVIEPPLPPKVIPENILYPNPVSSSLYYYHSQTDTTQQQIAYMYNLQGELVQQFSLLDNNITHIIDVINFANGVYVFVVKNKEGSFIRREKVVVQH